MLCQPRIEFCPIGPAPVAHVFHDDAFLPAAGDIAELWLEQIVTRHGFKAGVDLAFLACQHLIDSRLHVVVNAALRYTAESFKRSGVRVKQHFVALPGVGHQPEGAAGAQLGVCQLNASPDPATFPLPAWLSHHFN